MIPRRTIAGLSLAIILATLLVFLPGCSSLASSPTRIAATGLEPGDAIAIVPHVMGDKDDAFESALALCVQDTMKEMDTGTRFMSQHEFQAAVFADRKQADRPLCDDIMKLAVEDSQVRSLLEPLGLRYLVCVSGVSGFAPSESPRVRSAGGTGSHALGAIWIQWRKYSNVQAEIYDLKNLSHAGSLYVYAEDTGVVGVIPPLLIPAMTETRTCRRFGREVAQFLVGKEQPISGPKDSVDTQDHPGGGDVHH